MSTHSAALSSALDHAATVSFRRLYFVKIKLFSGALATIKFCHKLLNYSFTGEFIEVRTYKKYLYFVPSFGPSSGERITPSE